MQGRPLSEEEFQEREARRHQLEDEMSQLLAIHHQTSMQRTVWKIRLSDIEAGNKVPDSLTFFDYYRDKRKLHPAVEAKLDEYLLVLKNKPYQDRLLSDHVAHSKQKSEDLKAHQAVMARGELFRNRLELGIVLPPEESGAEKITRRPG